MRSCSPVLRLQLEKHVTHRKTEISHSLLLVEQGAEETPQSLSVEHSQPCGRASLWPQPQWLFKVQFLPYSHPRRTCPPTADFCCCEQALRGPSHLSQAGLREHEQRLQEQAPRTATMISRWCHCGPSTPTGPCCLGS